MSKLTFKTVASTYKDLLYKSYILLGCAWHFAWLAAVVICLEMFFMYSYNKYPEVEDYRINTVSIQKPRELNVENNNPFVVPVSPLKYTSP